MSLLLHEVGHICLYLLVVLVAKVVVKQKLSWKLLIVGLALTLLIDADHLFDYVLAHGPVLNLPAMLSSDYFAVNGKVFVLLHSWELVLIFLGGYLVAKRKYHRNVSQALLILGIALTVHLLFDILYYGFNPLVYFVTYRAWRGFGLGVFARIL